MKIKTFCSLLGNNLNPIPVRILNKINSHFVIHKTNTSHLTMFPQRSLVIANGQSQMKFPFPQIIFLGMVCQPRQLQFKTGIPVPEIYNNIVASVFRTTLSGQPPNLFQPQRLLIKSYTFG